MGLILQGPPLGSSLSTEGSPTSNNLAVLWSQDHIVVWKCLLFQLAHGKPLGQAHHFLLIGLEVLRVGSVGHIASGMASLLWSIDCVVWIVVMDQGIGIESCDRGNRSRGKCG